MLIGSQVLLMVLVHLLLVLELLIEAGLRTSLTLLRRLWLLLTLGVAIAIRRRR